ncbi:MAG: hypothetical protein ACRDTD_14300 [Pseudonocardiaceae bacterium]
MPGFSVRHPCTSIVTGSRRHTAGEPGKSGSHLRSGQQRYRVCGALHRGFRRSIDELRRTARRVI